VPIHDDPVIQILPCIYAKALLPPANARVILTVVFADNRFQIVVWNRYHGCGSIRVALPEG
jgi:hypothetical protein